MPDTLQQIPIQYDADSPTQYDANVDWAYPQDFLDAFHATRGLCPANPEGDVAFMHFLYTFAQVYAATHVFVPAVIDSISPDTAPAGGPDFLLDIFGTDLVAGSILNFGTATGPITHVSDTHAQAMVNAEAYANAGTIPVTIQAPGGVADSNAVDFTAT
jgi:hypothetical protein